MTLKLKAHILCQSDFHIGAGTGVGAVADSVVMRSQNGVPIIPGSTIKGLARDAVLRLPEMLRSEKLVNQLFGIAGHNEGVIRFGNAEPAKQWLQPAVHGRSAIDRTTGRAMDKALFRMEDAAACLMISNITSTRPLQDDELVILISALRRIEHIGGQRRRGKGHVTIKVEIKSGPENWIGVEVPGNANKFEQAFRRFGKDAASSTQNVVQGGAIKARSNNAEARTGQETVMWCLAHADSPLVLSAIPEAGSATQSLDFISGTRLRGGIASALLGNGWSADEPVFQEVFVQEKVQFGPLYPSKDWKQGRSFPIVAPASLLTCKYNPGLKGRDTHGTHDAMRSEEFLNSCSVEGCSASLSPLGGFLQAERQALNTVLTRVSTRFGYAAHVSIDHETQRAREGLLFSNEQLGQGTWFAGYIWGNQELLEAIRQSLKGLSVTIGKARTRGNGSVTVIFSDPSATGKKHHNTYPGLLPASYTWLNCEEYFELMLYSDLIALDPLLRPITHLDGTALWTLLNGNGTTPFELDRGYTGSREISGYNGVPGRPRTIDVAMLAGSVLRYRWTDSSRKEEARNLLEAATKKGLGLRKGEGFGRIILDLSNLGNSRSLSAQNDNSFPLEVVQPSVPPVSIVQNPKRSAPHSRPIKEMNGVPLSDREGLARMCWEIEQSEEPAKELKQIIEARKSRYKSESGTDKFLERLSKMETVIEVKEQLRVCAIELIATAANERGSRNVHEVD